MPDLGIDEPGGTDDLLDDPAPGFFHFVLRGRRRDIDDLVNPAVKLLEGEGPVVQGRREAEPVLHQGLFPGPVPPVHGVELGDCDVALVEEHQVVFREVVQEGVRGIARLAPVQVARVVFDPRAVAHLLEHLEVKVGPLFQPLSFQQLSLGVKLGKALGQLLADGLDGPAERVLGGDVMAAGEDGDLAELPQDPSAEGVDLGDGVDQVAEEIDPDGLVLLVSREDLQHIPADAKSSPVEIVVVPLVLDLHQAGQEVVAGDFLLVFHEDDHPLVGFGRAQAVDAGDRSHHDHVRTGQGGTGGRMAHLVDQVVDGRVLLDVSVRRGDVGLGLVVIVVADEVLHRVLGEEGPELLEELGRQGLVRGDDQRGFPDALDHLGHGEGLARTGHPQENLVGQAFFDPPGKLLDSLRLVPFRLKGRYDFEIGHKILLDADHADK